MSAWKRFTNWISGRADSDLDRELRAHLESEADEQQQAGLPPLEARYAARRAFGNVDRAKEETRQAWGWAVFEQLGQDLRYAMRVLRKNPGFSTVAVSCLALGIGANTAIFSLMNAVLLKSLPIEDPGQLVLFRYVSRIPPQIKKSSSGYGASSLSFATFEAFRDHSQTLASVFAFAPLGIMDDNVTVSMNGRAGLADGEMVSGQYFSALGVTPILGRLIEPEDVDAAAPGVAVISHSYWTRQFARDATAVGATVALNGSPFTIVGVTPPEFFGLNHQLAPDIWIPLREERNLGPWGEWSESRSASMLAPAHWWYMIAGRRKPGITDEQIQAELDPLFQRSILAGVEPLPAASELPHIAVLPAGRGLHMLRERLSEPLFVLMTAVGVVLLIACANVATLLLARSASRQKEMSVRLATGASRSRVVRQLLTESLVLAALGGGIGLLLARWGSRVLLALLSPPGQSIALDVHADATVFAFSAFVCILTGTLFGLAPAFRATRVDLARGLQETGRATSPRLGLGKVLVAGQVALSLLLLIGAGLFIRTLHNLVNQDLGFESRNLLVFALDPRRGGYTQERLSALYQSLLENITALPEVRSATASALPLLSGWMSGGSFSTDGSTMQGQPSKMAHRSSVGPAFFETLGIPIVLGRGIEPRDVTSTSRVAVVNEAMARHFFPDGSALGRHFSLEDTFDPGNAFEIIGIAGNAKYDDARDEPPRTAYLPYTSRPLGRLYFLVRTVGDPGRVLPAVSELVRRVDGGLPLLDVKTQTEQIEESLLQERTFAQLSLFFAALSLLLVAVGLYGTLAYAVTRRTNEIGLRLALGAHRQAVLWMILRESLALIAAGVAIGLPLAFATTRLLASRLYGVEPNDAATIVVAVLAIAVVGALAGYLPARRAARVDPIVALRYE